MSMGRRGPKNVIRPVVQYTMDGEFVARYESLSDAARAINLSVQNVAAATKSRTVSAGGYIWAYDDEEALLKVKINDLALDLCYQERYSLEVQNTYELQLLYARFRRQKTWKLTPRLLKDGSIRVTFERNRKDKLTGIISEPPKSKKPKWWICYEVNMRYKYALDFGRGDTEEEAIKDFHQSRIDSDLTHTVIYIDQDYEKVRDYLLRKGGRNGKGSVQRLYEAANLLPQQMPRISGI